MPTALLSAYDKTGAPEFATNLYGLGWKLLASGGTGRSIAAAGLEVTDVATIVGEPILGHRVVTLSRQIHAALLATYATEDELELKRTGISRIDLVYVNLYPLATELQKPDKTLESVLEMTDIGGPAMLMAAIKGQRIVVVDQSDFPLVIDGLHYAIADSVDYQLEVWKYLAAKATATVAAYYLGLGKYLSNDVLNGMVSPAGLRAPERPIRS